MPVEYNKTFLEFVIGGIVIVRLFERTVKG